MSRKSVQSYSKRFRDDLVIAQVETDNGIQNQPANQIYNALVALVHMLRHQSSDTTFPQRVAELIQARSADNQRAMGFPEDWEARSCWSKRD